MALLMSLRALLSLADLAKLFWLTVTDRIKAANMKLMIKIAAVCFNIGILRDRYIKIS
jgi:hypothetical protein